MRFFSCTTFLLALAVSALVPSLAMAGLEIDHFGGAVEGPASLDHGVATNVRITSASGLPGTIGGQSVAEITTSGAIHSNIATATMGGGSFVFSSTQATSVTLLFDGVTRTAGFTYGLGLPVNGDHLAHVNLGPSNAFFQFSFSSISAGGHGIHYEIDVNNKNFNPASSSNLAVASGTFADTGSAVKDNVLFSSFTNKSFLQNATAIVIKLTPNGGTPFNFNLTNITATVPEPGTMALWGLGVVGLAGVRAVRARRRKSAEA